ncbi:T9SS type A sorting domain-containing protein [candidate division KSB1 bacterium]|nr:T9SS type A sorting domain-containing protein [candidate division KSB1 bacterium]
MPRRIAHNRLLLTGVLALTTALQFAVAQPLEPLGSLNMTPRTGLRGVADRVYCVGNNNFAVVDVSDPASPMIIGQVAPGVPALATVDVSGGFAYCAGGATGLVIIESTDPSDPVWRTNLALAGQVRDAVVLDTLVAVATSANVSLIGVRNPLQPHLLTTFGRISSSVRWDPQGTKLYVGSQTGAFALSVQHYDSAGATRYRLTAAGEYGSQEMTPHDIAGSYVTYARGADAVAVRASNYSLAGIHSVPSAIRAVAGGNGFSFVALATGSLQYLDQRGDTPEFVAAAGLPSTSTGLTLAHGGGQPLVVASTSAGLSIFAYTPLVVDDNPHSTLPQSLSLQAFPNPFNPSVTLTLSVPVPGDYALDVFDLTGRIVSSEHRFMSALTTTMLDFSGLASGVYFARLHGAALSTTTKLLYLP